MERFGAAPLDAWGALVQLYEEDAAAVETLARFVEAGLAADDAVVAIATAEHRAAADDLLRVRGVAVDGARGAGRYVSLDAGFGHVLHHVMVDER